MCSDAKEKRTTNGHVGFPDGITSDASHHKWLNMSNSTIWNLEDPIYGGMGNMHHILICTFLGKKSGRNLASKLRTIKKCDSSMSFNHIYVEK